MFNIVLKKLLKNRWMTICMLTGSILIIALLSSIPVYSKGVLQRVLTKDMESIQSRTSIYPGTLTIDTNFGSSKTEAKTQRQINKINETIEGIKANYELDVLSESYRLTATRLTPYSDYANGVEAGDGEVSLATMSDIGEHIKLNYGRLFQPRDDGVIEVILTSEAMAKTSLLMNTQYELGRASWRRTDSDYNIKIEVVGVFAISDEADVYWTESLSDFGKMVFCSTDDFEASIFQNADYLQSGHWSVVLDYYGITLQNSDKINLLFEDDVKTVESIDSATINWPVIDILAGFGEKQNELNFSLIVIELPVILLLAFYIFMVSQLIMDTEANEIAVLKSRGASSWHIFAIYLLQGCIISVVSLVIGPLIGLGMCYMLGGANGFLEFVNRTALQVSLSWTAYFYGILAAVFFMITMLLPAIKASRQTILTHKQQVARSHKTPLWKKIGLDFVLIAIAVYGLYSYFNQQDMISKLSMADSEAAVDPLMLLISTLFILGVGLLFLRIYPLIIKLIFVIGKKWWNPVFYLSLTQVGRSSGQEQFLMLFLVFTIGVSIFSANTARTINTNKEENLVYVNGADIVIKNEWKYDYAYVQDKKFGYTVYQEVDYTPYTEIDGIEAGTKVYRGTAANIYGEIRVSVDRPVGLLAIVPDEFAETAQMRNGLTPYHWYNYCNLLTDYDNVVLMASAFQELGFSVGDTIIVNLQENAERTCVIGAFIDYWPGINPYDTVPGALGRDGNVVYSPYFIVTAFDTVFKEEFDIPVQPYEIWLNKSDDVTSNYIYNQIAEQGLQIDSRVDLTEDLVSLKNDPTLQSLNGALTLCFIVSLIVCFVGFLIYWIIAIKKRVLQFGIIRAMGMKVSNLIGMLLLEQVLISGSSIMAGIGIGIITSYFYIPIYSMTQSSSDLMIPFRTVSEPGDYTRLYIILGAILVVGFIVLSDLIRKIKINQALKIGED